MPPPSDLKVEDVAFGELGLRYDPLWHCTGYEGYYLQATKGDCGPDPIGIDKEGSWKWSCHKSANGLRKVDAALRYIELVQHIRSDPKLGGESSICEREEADEEELLYYVQGVIEHEVFSEPEYEPEYDSDGNEIQQE